MECVLAIAGFLCGFFVGILVASCAVISSARNRQLEQMAEQMGECVKK